mgnify:CR=1 FL=1
MSIKRQIINLKFLNKITFYIGFLIFKLTGKTPFQSYMSMIRLYCITNGEFLDRFNRKYLSNDNKINYKTESSIVKELSKNNKKEIAENLQDEGYVKLDFLLEETIISKLTDISLNIKATVNNELMYFDPQNIVSNIYRFPNSELLNQDIVQQLIMDPLLIGFAQDYFKCEPIFDYAAMWYSTNFKGDISDDAAQFYHFDLDRPKWLKIFFYLNDVNEDNGPHCYISKSHKSFSKPEELLERGYSRISDSDIRKFYSEDRFKEVKGEKGSIILGDTISWHKGKPIKSGTRLIFQIQFTSSLFGIIPKAKISNYSKDLYNFYLNNKNYMKNIQLN